MDAAMTMREPLGAGRFFAPGERSLATMLQARAGKYGAKPFVQAGERSWSFAEAPELAARSAGRLHAAGLRQGDRVALICENRPEFIKIFLGAAWLGSILVPINTASRGPQLRHILENSGARLLVIEASLLGALEHVGLDTLPLEAIWVIDRPNADVRPPELAQPMPALGEAIAAASTRPSDTLAILYTSGTTGPSKGVCCPHAQFFWWGVNTAHLLGVGDEDILCTTLPLFHPNALNTFFQALITGATVWTVAEYGSGPELLPALSNVSTVKLVLPAVSELSAVTGALT